MKISIRIVLILLMVLLAVSSCTIIGVLIAQAGIDSANEGADLLRGETVHRKQLEIARYFDHPLSVIHSLQAASKVEGTFNYTDINSFHPWLCLMFRLNDDRFTYVGTELGTFAAAKPTPGEANKCLIKMMDARHKLQSFAEYNFSEFGSPKLAKPWYDFDTAKTGYDPRQRPWYNASKHHTSWSPVYLNWDKLYAVTTVGTPVFDPITGRNVGVFATDFTTDFLVRYLNNNTAAKTGRMVVVEGMSRQVIGASWNESAVVSEKGVDHDCGEFRNLTCMEFRLATLEDLVKEPMLTDALASLGADYMYTCNDLGRNNSLAEECKTDFGRGRKRVFVDIIAIKDAHGLDLRLIILIPESDFLAQVWSRGDLAAIIASVVIAVLITGSVMVVYGLLKPLKRVEERLYLSARLNNFDETNEPISLFTEVANIQEAHAKMSAQLVALRSYVPQSLLQNFDASLDKETPGLVSVSRMSSDSQSMSKETNPFVRSEMEDTWALHSTSTVDAANSVLPVPLTLNVDRVNAQVNNFRATNASMLVVCLSARSSPSNLEAFSAETASFMDATIPQILRSRGVIELQRPNQIVATFDRGVHIERAAHCALRIAKAHNRAGLVAVSALHSGTFVTGACGSRGRNAFVVASDFFHRGVKIAELSQRCLRSPVVVTDAVAKSLPTSIEATPIDRVRGLDKGTSEDDECIIFQITKRHRGFSKKETPALAKEVFTLMLQGNYSSASAKVDTLPASQLNGQLARLGKIASMLDGRERSGYVREYSGWAVFPCDEELTSGAASGIPSAPDSSTSDDDGIDGTTTHIRKHLAKHSSVKELIGFGSGGDDEPESPGLQLMSPPMDVMSGGEPEEYIERSADEFDGLTTSQHLALEHQIDSTVDNPLPSRVTDFRGVTWFKPSQAPKLGEGAFSSVHQGMNAQGDIVALKCIDLHGRTFAGDKALETEVAVLSEIHHPNLANFISVAAHESFVILVLEYVAGGTLRTVIKTYRQLLPRAAARRFAVDILNGLQYLHDRDVVHGDVKPENVLVGADSVCKLTDFGSSVERRLAECSPSDECDGPDLRGTAPYMAPEVAVGELPTAASDIWSFGVLMHELITGDLPWVHESGPAGAAKCQVNLLRGLARSADDPTALRPKISIVKDNDKKQAVALLEACLRENPSERPRAKDVLTFGFLL